jgi:hypothetical protein
MQATTNLSGFRPTGGRELVEKRILDALSKTSSILSLKVYRGKYPRILLFFIKYLASSAWSWLDKEASAFPI